MATKKTTKKPVNAQEPVPPPVPAKPVGLVLGPGVVKRPKKDPAELAAQADAVPYQPSEQVFRRR